MKTATKFGELESDISKFTTKIDQAGADLAKLKGDLNELLAQLAKQRAERDNTRYETHADYTQAKPDHDLGLVGVRVDPGVLHDYGSSAVAAALMQDNAHHDALMQKPSLPEKHEKTLDVDWSTIETLDVVEYGSEKS